MLPPMVVLSPSTKKHTLVSFNRVIIVASTSRISSLDLLVLLIKITRTIDAKKETKQDEWRDHPERAAAAAAVSQQAQMQQ